MASKKPTALGAYIFAGGFTLGVENHFDVLAHFEGNDYGVSTFRAARPRIPVHVGADAWPWEGFVDRVAFLYGNPPCAAWSPLGPRAQRGMDAWKKDERVDCTRTHFNLAELIRPTVWAWESVPQAFTTGRPFVDHLTERATKLGYAVDYVLHNAMHVGAYQSRKRFFMVATAVDIDWSCPWTPCPSATEALAAIPGAIEHEGWKPDHYYPMAFLKMIPPGAALRGVYPAYLEKTLAAYEKKHGKPMPEEIRKRAAPRPSFGERRLPADKPPGAIVDSLIVHPTEDRYLSLQEMMWLGGWPLDYPLQGVSIEHKARLLTRTVLPPVGNWLAGEVAKGLRANRTAPPGRVREVNLYNPPGQVVTL